MTVKCKQSAIAFTTNCHDKMIVRHDSEHEGIIEIITNNGTPFWFDKKEWPGIAEKITALVNDA